jgi:hypothetical protein
VNGAEAARAAERGAARLAKERRLRQVRPGWWVFSYGPTDLGSWGKVTATAETTDPTTGQKLTHLTLTDRAGRRVEIEQASSYPVWCCTPAEARRAGLA